jgi:hypothetical protein
MAHEAVTPQSSPVILGGRVGSWAVLKNASTCFAPAARAQGGACATRRGGEGGMRPMFRSICAAVERQVTMAVTLRLPPQGHCHTSTCQVLACNVAQSSRGRFTFVGGPGAVVGVARSLVGEVTAGGITDERALECEENTPWTGTAR